LGARGYNFDQSGSRRKAQLTKLGAREYNFDQPGSRRKEQLTKFGASGFILTNQEAGGNHS
jgi:hypothetical protein